MILKAVHLSKPLCQAQPVGGTFPLPINELARLDAVRDLQVLDTPAAPSFDALTRQAAAACDVPIALISLLDRDRQWFKSRHGPDLPLETPRSASFCTHAILGSELFEVCDATQDERFRDSPLVTGVPHMRFYAGMPLVTAGGHALGTLCVIDHRPRCLTDAQRTVLKDLAVVVVALLEGHKAGSESSQISQVLNSAFDEIIVLDPLTLRVQFVNRAAQRTLGYAQIELQEQNLHQFAVGYPVDTLKALGRSVLTPTPGRAVSQLTFEAEHRNRNGATYAVQVRALISGAAGAEQLLLLANDVSQRRDHERRLADLAVRDTVTRLPNRHHLEAHLGMAMQQARRSGTPLALMLVEIDRLQELRHAHGKQVADQVVAECAARLRRSVGASDLVAYLGGGEFAIVLEDYYDADAPRQTAVQVNDALTPVFRTAGGEIPVGACIGITLIGVDDETPHTLLGRADAALNEAARSGTSLCVLPPAASRSIAFVAGARGQTCH